MYMISDLEVDRFFGEYERKSAPPIGECDFCGGEIYRNAKSFILSDGRLVCEECAKEAFMEEFGELAIEEQAEILEAEAVV